MGFGLRVRVRVRVHVVWRLPRQANSRGHLLRVRVGLGFTLRITLDPSPNLDPNPIPNPKPMPGELMAEYLPEGTEGQTVVVELTLILT